MTLVELHRLTVAKQRLGPSDDFGMLHWLTVTAGKKHSLVSYS